jgi:hypothetical protein
MRTASLLLAILIVSNCLAIADQAAPAAGTTQLQTRETPQSAKVKAKVQRRGIGENSRVKAKLVNGSEVKGYISKIEETSFTVTDQRTGKTTTVPFGDVQKIQGLGLSKGDKILIGVGVGVAVFVLAGYLFARSLGN